MQLTQKQKDFILNSDFGIIATSYNNQPRACVAIPEIAEEDYVIFADIQMKKTNINLQNNSKIFVSFYDKKLINCLKANGKADYIKSGDVFEKIKNKLAKENLKVKAIVKIYLTDIFEGKEE